MGSVVTWKGKGNSCTLELLEVAKITISQGIPETYIKKRLQLDLRNLERDQRGP